MDALSAAGDCATMRRCRERRWRATARALAELQELLAEPRLAAAPVVWVTRSAVGTGPDDRVTDLAHAPLWGLVRSARSEHPDRRLRLVDLDAASLSDERIAALLCADDEADLALRYGVPLAARLVRADQDAMGLPEGLSAWRLAQTSPGSMSHFELVEIAAREVAPGPGEVRVEVRAAGMNFRDVLNALGMVPAPWLGLELAGVVIEVGEGVHSVCVGDRVMGLGRATFATVATADARWLTRVPDRLSFVEASTVPLVFLTALYGLQRAGGAAARRAGPGARRGGWRRHGGGAACAPSWRGGVRDGEPSQVARAARDGARRRAHRLLAGHELCGRVFCRRRTAPAWTSSSIRSPAGSSMRRCACFLAGDGSSRWARRTSVTPRLSAGSIQGSRTAPST